LCWKKTKKTFKKNLKELQEEEATGLKKEKNRRKEEKKKKKKKKILWKGVARN
jgi:Sec-independent protein translocase protein TatA